jgi:hypothetical protein
VLLFTSADKRRKEAQGFLTKIINNNCPRMGALREGPRDDLRINLTLPVYVVPFDGKNADAGQAASAVTKELSTSGMSIVTRESVSAKQVLIALQWDGATQFFSAEIRYQEPFGAGNWHAGLLVQAMLPVGDYPEVAALPF